MWASFSLFFSPSFSLLVQNWWFRSEPTPTPLSNLFLPPSVFVLSGDLTPSHQSIRFTAVPPGSFWRWFHLIISLKKIFFPGQYEVTDHIRTAFRLSDHLIKLRSISLPLFSEHLFFLGLRGEVSGLGPLNPIPTKALEVNWVTYTNSQGFRAWLSVPYSPMDSPEILLLAPDPNRYSPSPNVCGVFWSPQVPSQLISIDLRAQSAVVKWPIQNTAALLPVWTTLLKLLGSLYSVKLLNVIQLPHCTEDDVDDACPPFKKFFKKFSCEFKFSSGDWGWFYHSRSVVHFRMMCFNSKLTLILTYHPCWCIYFIVASLVGGEV